MAAIPKELRVELQIIYHAPRKSTHPTTANLPKTTPTKQERKETKKASSSASKKYRPDKHGRGHDNFRY